MWPTRSDLQNCAHWDHIRNLSHQQGSSVFGLWFYPCLIPRLAAVVLPGNLLEMQMLCSHHLYTHKTVGNLYTYQTFRGASLNQVLLQNTRCRRRGPFGSPCLKAEAFKAPGPKKCGHGIAAPWWEFGCAAGSGGFSGLSLPLFSHMCYHKAPSLGALGQSHPETKVQR